MSLFKEPTTKPKDGERLFFFLFSAWCSQNKTVFAFIFYLKSSIHCELKQIKPCIIQVTFKVFSDLLADDMGKLFYQLWWKCSSPFWQLCHSPLEASLMFNWGEKVVDSYSLTHFRLPPLDLLIFFCGRQLLTWKSTILIAAHEHKTFITLYTWKSIICNWPLIILIVWADIHFQKELKRERERFEVFFFFF